jgi:hypothetical protein
MRVLDITEIKLERIDLVSLTQHKPKPYVIPPGTIGTTAILRYIATTLSHLKLHEEDVTDLPWRILIGMGWETMCAQMYPDMVWPAPVVKLGGIAGHPDANSWISGMFGDVKLDDAFCVDEFKYTARSRREKGAKATDYKDIRREWMWNGQLMGYIAMLWMNPRFRHLFGKHLFGKSPRLLGRFHIMWAMGCYEKYTLDEMYVRYLVEYTPEEIEKHWETMKRNEEAARLWIMSEESARLWMKSIGK